MCTPSQPSAGGRSGSSGPLREGETASRDGSRLDCGWRCRTAHRPAGWPTGPPPPRSGARHPSGRTAGWERPEGEGPGVRKRARPRTRSSPSDCRVAPSPARAKRYSPGRQDCEAQGPCVQQLPPYCRCARPERRGAHRHPMSFSRAYAAMTRSTDSAQITEREPPRESADGVAGRRSLLAVGEADDREAGELARRMARFSTHSSGSILDRGDVQFLSRKRETAGTPTPPGVEFVRYRRSHGLGFHATGPQTPRIAVRTVFRARHGSGGLRGHPVGQGLGLRVDTDGLAGRDRVPGWRVRRGSRRPDPRPRRGNARRRHRRRGSGGGASRRPPLQRRAGNRGVRGGAAPRQAPAGELAKRGPKGWAGSPALAGVRQARGRRDRVASPPAVHSAAEHSGERSRKSVQTGLAKRGGR